MRARRTWRKLHLAVDAQTAIVIASTLTANDMGDPSQDAALLDQADARIGSVTADGAYDGAPTYDAVAAHAGDIPVIIPPHVTAVPGASATHHTSQRDRHIAVMAAKGRLGWQEEISYCRRSLVETAMGRYKTVIAPGLRAQPARPTHGGSRRCGGTQSHVYTGRPNSVRSPRMVS